MATLGDAGPIRLAICGSEGSLDDEGLQREETPTSPRDWLYSGGSPEVAVALAQELGVGL